MRKKERGDTLKEKIEHVLGKIKKKKVTNLIESDNYELKFEKGIPFQIRQTNLLQDVAIFRTDLGGNEVKINNNRVLNVADEKHAEEMRLRQEAIEKVWRDKTFEEFMAEF